MATTRPQPAPHRRIGALLVASCTVFLAATVSASDEGRWTPPTGIPKPSFGIEEKVEAIYGKAYCTHFIDNTHAKATDEKNPKGTREKPRKTIPSTLELKSGDVVEIAGGPYKVGRRDRLSWKATATAEKPAFIRGATGSEPPVIAGLKEKTVKGVRVTGEHLIVERLVFDMIGVGINGRRIALRHAEVRNYKRWSGGGGSGVYAIGHDIVVFGNHIHHNGDAETKVQRDVHGVNSGPNTERLWVLDNHIHHNGGDAFQVGHSRKEPWARYVYLGRNRMHHDRENAIDLKRCRDVIISGNETWGYGDSPASDGTAIIMHYDPERIWVIYNNIHDSCGGIRNNVARHAYFIGNVIHAIKGNGIVTWQPCTMHVVNNTLYNVGTGIRSQEARKSDYHIINNIIANLSNEKGLHIAIDEPTPAKHSEMRHNLIFQPGGSARITWGTYGKDAKVYDLAGFRQAFSGQGEGCVTADPLFVNPQKGDFRLKETGPAIDAGEKCEAYAVFKKLYGLDIFVDFAGKKRPERKALDMGAFEHSGRKQ